MYLSSGFNFSKLKSFDELSFVRPKYFWSGKYIMERDRTLYKFNQDKIIVDNLKDRDKLYKIFGEATELYFFHKKHKDFLKEFKIGNTRNNDNFSKECYFGKIVEMIGYFGYNNWIRVTRDNFEQIRLEYRDWLRYNTPYFMYFGIKVFKSLEEKDLCWRIENGEQDSIFYYRDYELIPMNQIISYEHLKPGEIVNFPRSMAFVVSNRLERAFSTKEELGLGYSNSIYFNSLSLRNVKIMPLGNNKRNRIVNFFPDTKRIISMS